MNKALCALLRDPVARGPLTWDEAAGELASAGGGRYPVRNGIPRFVLTEDAGQIQTRDAFGFKWAKRDTYDTPEFRAFAAEWYSRKYGFGDEAAMARFFAGRGRILDVGCGSAFSSALYLRHPAWSGRAMWVGADISSAVDVAQERLRDVANTHFVQADALQLPFADGAFDTVFSEGVLHHTPSTRAALLSAARVVARGGEFLFYVYRKKAPLREYADDYIRGQIAPLTDEQAWEAMRSLTRFGQALAELKASVTVPEDVPLLGIRAGAYDIQRLLYYDVVKMYWNAKLSFEENVHVNFDWYRPRYAHRQTAEEVRAWCAEAGLEIARFHEEESGFSVRAVRR
ncbi:MAG TPA: methyltransferase domain-containing protein [Kiritimatiellia bacterium]|nr:methyltransferase domain-containing protein [Kiritimatiellia bacterium]HRZ12581.1 methyltransferase domain-containing protein [Kiritimatiellia bacterium]HSA17659.1 methyltransferase domain-containing protein [Kiritimatiellia bacterium]